MRLLHDNLDIGVEPVVRSLARLRLCHGEEWYERQDPMTAIRETLDHERRAAEYAKRTSGEVGASLPFECIAVSRRHGAFAGMNSCDTCRARQAVTLHASWSILAQTSLTLSQFSSSCACRAARLDRRRSGPGEAPIGKQPCTRATGVRDASKAPSHASGSRDRQPSHPTLRGLGGQLSARIFRR